MVDKPSSSVLSFERCKAGDSVDGSSELLAKGLDRLSQDISVLLKDDSSETLHSGELLFSGGEHSAFIVLQYSGLHL